MNKNCTMASNYLFVYGTLRQAYLATTPVFAVVTAYCQHYGLARMPGKLYEVNGYPGAVDAIMAGDWVQGEVYGVLQEDQVFFQLDTYEECSPAFPQPHEYQRVQRWVTLANGQRVTAWVYLYQDSLTNRQYIPSGDYSQYVTALTGA